MAFVIVVVSGLFSVGVVETGLASPIPCEPGYSPEIDSNGNVVTDPDTGAVSCVPY
jgi:hypothetical protein